MSRPAPGAPAAAPTASYPAPAPDARPVGEVAVAGAPAPAPVRAGTPAPQTRRDRPTPNVLRGLRTLAVLMTLLFTVTTVALMLQTRHGMDQGARDTEQYTRVQDVQSHLLSAHALAANDVLQQASSNGASSTSAYRQEVSTAQQLLMAASNAQPQDRDVLTRASSAVLRYNEAVQAARDANRQGLPVGNAQLADAQRILTTEAIPALQAASDANSRRIDASAQTFSPLWILAAGALTVLTLLIAAYVLARRTHRVVNLGLLLAILLVAAATYLGMQTMSQVNSDLRGMQAQDLASISRVAGARADAARAKANESLALVYRSSESGPYERDWSVNSYHARKQLTEMPDGADRTNLRAAWAQYVKVHRAIRESIMGGDYQGAVDRATGTGPDASNARYRAFDSAAADVVASHATRAAATQRDLGGRLYAMAPLAAALALAAMAAAALGINQRLKEYR